MRFAPVFRCILIGLLLCGGLLGGLTAAAQDATPEADDPTGYVLAAIDRLAEGYAYDLVSDAVQVYTNASGADVSLSYIHFTTSAQVAGNGDFHVNATEEVRSKPLSGTPDATGTYERATVGGAAYLNLLSDFSPLAGVYPFDQIRLGWQRLDDLEARLNDPIASTRIDTVFHVQFPTDIPINPTYILSTTEGNPEELDGVPMRVFTIDLDAAKIAAANAVRMSTDSFNDFAAYATILAAGRFEFTATVWIGAEDGQVRRISVEHFSLMPYLTAGGENTRLPQYDWKYSGSYTYDIDRHGEIGAVAVPEIDPSASEGA